MNGEAYKHNEEEEWGDPYPKEKSKRVNGFITVIVVLVIYVLSTGPAFLLYKKGKVSLANLDRIYHPLNLLVDSVPAVKRITNWYIDLWVDRAAQNEPQQQTPASPHP